MNRSCEERSRRRIRNIGWMLKTIILCLLVEGCSTPSQESPDHQATITAPPVERTSPSPLSYGTITSTVKKGTTTQAELVNLFGGPNISTIDSDGAETWVYERTSSDTTSTNQTTVTAQAERLDAFFSLGLLGRSTSNSQQKSESTGASTVSHSIRTLTVIVKFNQDKTVKDYSARASSF